VDHLGSVRLVTDAAGAVANRYDYDAFGNWADTAYETVANPFGFTARERDAESGLMFYRARYYDPKIGRFISEDPIGFSGGDLNLYRYVYNLPLVLTDPIGNAAILETLWNRRKIIAVSAVLGALLGALDAIADITNQTPIHMRNQCPLAVSAVSTAFGAALGAAVSSGDVETVAAVMMFGFVAKEIAEVVCHVATANMPPGIPGPGPGGPDPIGS
jgi:RHS repeat-associated protein